MTNHNDMPLEDSAPGAPEHDAAGTPIARFGGLPWRVAETDAGAPAITAEQWEAACNDPEAIQFLKEAEEENEKWEETEWGFQLKPEYRPTAEEASLLRKGIGFLGNLGKTALNGDLGKAMSEALGRHL